MRNVVEETLDVRVDHIPPGIDPFRRECSAFDRTTPRAEPERAGKEYLLIDGLHQKNQRPLNDAVLDRGDSERPFPSIPFGNVDPANRNRTVRFRLELLLELPDEAPTHRPDLVTGDLVDAGRTTIPQDEFRSVRQDVRIEKIAKQIPVPSASLGPLLQAVLDTERLRAEGT